MRPLKDAEFALSPLASPLLAKKLQEFFKQKGISTLEQVARLSYRVFKNQYGLGAGSLENVIAFLKIHNLQLKEMPPRRRRRDVLEEERRS